MCAFLNQAGGQVLFGVTRAGIVACQQASKRTNEELSAELRKIYPPAFTTIERVRVDVDREVIRVGLGRRAYHACEPVNRLREVVLNSGREAGVVVVVVRMCF